MTKHVLDSIKAIRKLKGISQSQMAEKLGIVVSGYGKIENGKIQLTLERLERIAEILEVSVETLMKFSGEKNLALLHFTSNQNPSQAELEKASAQLIKDTPSVGKDDGDDLMQFEGDVHEFIRSFPPEKILRYAIENRNLRLERTKIFDIICETVFDKLPGKNKTGLTERFLKKVKAHDLIAKLLVSEVLTDRDVEVITRRFLKYKGMSG